MGCEPREAGGSSEEASVGALPLSADPCTGAEIRAQDRVVHDPAFVRSSPFSVVRALIRLHRYAALLSVIVACIPPVQATLDRFEALRGSVFPSQSTFPRLTTGNACRALKSAGNVSVPLTMVRLCISLVRLLRLKSASLAGRSRRLLSTYSGDRRLRRARAGAAERRKADHRSGDRGPPDPDTDLALAGERGCFCQTKKLALM